jgi:pimeloyl-ACP methyl ester carboxylesterase
VAFLADYLALDQFAVFGVSSGGPNAAVCARFLGDRIRGCAVVSSPAPFDPSIADEGMRSMNRIGRRAVRIAPGFVAFTASLLARRMTPERTYEFACKDLPRADLTILRRPDVRAALLHEFARPPSPTALRAAVQDFTLEVHDWGFRLEDIAIPVHVWHGDQDRNLPIDNGLRIAAAIPNATFHRVTGAGHWFSYDRFADVIRQSTD